jgi:hypothetical protein
MSKTNFSAKEVPVFLGWLVASIVLSEALDNFPSLVLSLQPVTAFLLSDLSYFSRWNNKAPFNTAEIRTLTAVFLLLVPVQIFTLFLIPHESVFPKLQAKGVFALATSMVVLVLILLLTFARGLSINGPLKIFGKESSWGAAAHRIANDSTLCQHDHYGHTDQMR